MSFGVLREKNTVSLTTGVSDLIKVSVVHVERIGVEINATNVLASFTIKASFNTPNKYNTLYSVSADYTSPTCPLVGTSGDLTVLSGDGWFMLDTRGMAEVLIQASSASTSDINISVGG